MFRFRLRNYFVAGGLSLALALSSTIASAASSVSSPAVGVAAEQKTRVLAVDTFEGVEVPHGNVRYIIQLCDTSDKARQHASVKKDIAHLVDRLPGSIPLESVGDTDVEGLNYAFTASETYKPQFVDEGDFYNVFNGMSVTAPARLFNDIAKLKDVKNVFVDHTLATAVSLPAAVSNASALETTGADKVSEKGAGQVIAIIDSALDPDHAAFSGAVDANSIALTSQKVSTLKSQLRYGKNGKFFSNKIPFVYDYADRDSNVDTNKADMDHGTHVAGIASANAGQIRGTAPQAQLVFLKVATDSGGGIPTSAFLEALEDVSIICPDSVNISLGTDAGASEAENSVFKDVYAKLRNSGITVNVAASNAFSSAYKNNSGRNLPYATDPDSSTVGEPASFKESLAVASTDTVRAGAAPSSVTMSSFSSWGVSPDGSLKPEISAPGGNIYSSILGNSYGKMSGTSMATPQLAGISAQMHEHVKKTSIYSGLSDSERAKRVSQVLMSTAIPVRDSNDANSYVSPRKQGSGLVNVPAAMDTKVYLTVKEQKDASRVKADLGSSTNTWTFTAVLHNLGNSAASYKVDSAALSEQISNGFFQEHSKNWTNKGIEVKHSSENVSVPAGGTAEVKVTITAGKEFADYARQATNGTFVEGFTFFRGQNGAVDLSVPFCGFYGDWGTIPAFDATSYESASAHIYQSYLADYSSGRALGKGSSSAVRASYIMPMTGTLRSLEKITYTYKNSAGSVVKRYTYGSAPKSLFVPQQKKVFNVEAFIGQPVFTGVDDNRRQLSDGEYTLTIDADIDGSTRNQQLIYTFHYGRTSGSYVTNVQRSTSGGATASPSPSPTPTPSASPTTPVSPSPTPTATASPSASPTASASPTRPTNPRGGTDTISIRRGSRLYIVNKVDSSNEADALYSFLRTTDEVYAGDWDGDGVDTILVRRGKTFIVVDNLETAHVAMTFNFNDPSDQILVGDWDGDGRDSIAVRQGEEFYFMDSFESLKVWKELHVGGSRGLEVVAGDWSGRGFDTLAFRSGRTMIMLNSYTDNTTTTATLPSRLSGSVIAGDWNGDGVDTFGMRQGATYRLFNRFSSSSADVVATIGKSSDQPLIGNWDGK